MRRIVATRYVTPLREGGSLPAIIEANDDGLYVVKLRGAGQGPRALVAELIGGEVARALGLAVPELVFIELDPLLGRSEPDTEIRNLLKASAGMNLALDYLPGSLMFDPIVSPTPDARLASEVVWLDALITNVDRTARNTNLLTWHRRLWLIDHGAALYFHHGWSNPAERATAAFPAIRQHVLLPRATVLREVDPGLRAKLPDTTIDRIVSLLPDDWLGDQPEAGTPDAQRQGYALFLKTRRDASASFLEEAERARAALV